MTVTAPIDPLHDPSNVEHLTDTAGLLARLARTCVRRRWRVIAAWVLLLIAVNVAAGAAGPDFRTDFSLPSGEARDVQALLDEAAPDRAGFTGQIVFRNERGVDDPGVRSSMEEIFDYTVGQGDITLTSPYENPSQISEDGTIAFAQLDIRDSRTFVELQEVGTDIREFAEAANLPRGIDVEFGGDLFAEFELPESEIYGLIAAVVILIVAFGSVLAMGLPIGIALFGLGIASAVVTLGSHVIAAPDFTTAMVAMIGIGVGIDYALFIVTRYRNNLAEGHSVDDAIVQAIDTSGRAVVFAGITVVIALMGLFLMGLSFVQGVAAASSIGVAMMVAGSITLLPALLSLIGTRIENTTWAAMGAVGLLIVGAIVAVTTSAGAAFVFGLALAALLFAVSFAIKPLRRHVPHRSEPPKEQRFWYRWSRFIQRHPGPPAIGAVVLLVVLAVPVFSIRLGFGDYGNYPESTTVRQAYDLLAEGFGPGSNGPLFITVQGGTIQDPVELEQFVANIDSTEGVAFSNVSPINDELSLVIVYPDSAPQDEATSELVDRLRDDVIPATGADAKVGGLTAASTDFASYLGGRMPLLLGVVLVLSFLLLMAVFRSILVPLKAVVMNLLSIGAAYGVIVAIFQWGWARDLIGVDKAGPIDAWIPMFLFAIVFGLSMDYEVFLLSRIKEEYDRTRDNAAAVADGLAVTARVITAAALIMTCVFAAFVLGDDRAIKLFGLGLAVAVLLDATIVRMILVPATMELLGDRNWWIPRWLDRVLPSIDVEGHAAVPASGAHDDTIEPGPPESSPESTPIWEPSR